MGMSRSDFEDCTPTEFHAIHTAWAEREQHREQTLWEQVRILALCTLQPHSSQPLKPSDILPLPWDKSPSSAPELTPEERAARYADARRRYGFA